MITTALIMAKVKDFLKKYWKELIIFIIIVAACFKFGSWLVKMLAIGIGGGCLLAGKKKKLQLDPIIDESKDLVKEIDKKQEDRKEEIQKIIETNGAESSINQMEESIKKSNKVTDVIEKKRRKKKEVIKDEEN